MSARATAGGAGEDKAAVVTIAEALERGFPILDPLGNRLHYPGEEQYEAWRAAHRRALAARDGDGEGRG